LIPFRTPDELPDYRPLVDISVLKGDAYHVEGSRFVDG